MSAADMPFFGSFETVRFEGPDSKNSLAYRWYDANKVVLGKALRDHLRFAVAYWHSLAMNGSDPFGVATIRRPWMECSDVMQGAREKADAAFQNQTCASKQGKIAYDHRYTSTAIEVLPGRAWADIATDEQEHLLRQSVTDDVAFTNPVGEGEGFGNLVEHIGQFQKQFPGAYFKNSQLLTHHGQLLAEWTMYNKNGSEFLTGQSYARFSEQGRLTHLAGFFKV